MVSSVTNTDDNQGSPAREKSAGGAATPVRGSFWDLVVHHRLIFGFTIVICALGGDVAARLTPRVYRSEILLTPAVSEFSPSLHPQLGGYSSLASFVGVNLPTQGGGTYAKLAYLESRTFIEAFIAQHNLMPALFPKSWDSTRSRWKLKPNQTPPSALDGYSFFMKRVMRVLYDDRKDLVTIQIDWSDPNTAAQLANSLVASFNDAERARAITAANRNIEYLTRELGQTSDMDVKNSIYSLMTLQVEKRMQAHTQPEFAFQVIDPGQASDPGGYVRPTPLIGAGLGLFGGMLIGAFLSLLAEYGTLPILYKRGSAAQRRAPANAPDV